MTIRNARRIRPAELVVLSVALVLTAAAWVRCAPQKTASPATQVPVASPGTGPSAAPDKAPEPAAKTVRVAAVTVVPIAVAGPSGNVSISAHENMTRNVYSALLQEIIHSPSVH